MRLRKHCSAWLGLAGACLFVIGCGSDVPDPESDSQAASGNAPSGAGAAAPAPAVAAADAPAAPAVAAADAPKAQDAPPADAPPAQAEAPKEQPKAQGGGTTAEMLALAGGNNPAPPSDAAPGAAAPPAGAPPSAGPGGRGGPQMSAPGGGGPGAPGGGMMGRMMPPPGSDTRGQDPGKAMAGMQNQMKKMQESMANRGNGGGMPGAMGGGQGATTKDDGPADTSSPLGAVRTFLNALKAKDADRLSEATAQRAANEATGKNQETFSKILQVSLSDTELDDLAKKFDGYSIAGENPQKSTGRIDVVIQKSGENGSYYRRKITARREKKGWGVLDIGPEQRFAGMGGVRRKKGY